MRHVFTAYADAAWKPIVGTDSDGRIHKWHFAKARGYWFLREPDGGYVRTLEKTWAESVPRIRVIFENYGLTTEVS